MNEVNMKKEIIFVLLNGFADWEAAHLAVCLNTGIKPGRPVKYTAKTLALTKDPVISIDGFRVLPDYDIHTLPEDYAGLVLAGGDNWFSPEAESIVPLVEKMIRENKLVAGICNASVFLGKHGFLNHVKHTSNTLDYLKNMAGEEYTGEAHYIEKQAVVLYDCKKSKRTDLTDNTLVKNKDSMMRLIYSGSKTLSFSFG